MKKVFIYLSIVLMGVLICSRNVYADDVTGEATMDEKGHVTVGRAIVQDPSGCFYDLTYENSTGIFLLKHSDTYYSIHSVDDTLIDVSGVYYVDPTIITEWSSRQVTSGSSLYPLKEGTFLSTNIPIFSNTDEAGWTAYRQNGDKSSAENATEWRDSYDESIPLPHNLKVVSGVKQTNYYNNFESGLQYPYDFDKDVIIAWEQSDVVDGLEYDIDVCFYFLDTENIKDITEKNTAFYPAKQSIAYGTSKNLTCTLSAASLNSYYNAKTHSLLSKMVIRMRNKLNGKTSNWVSVTIDFHKQTASGNEEAYENDSDVKNEYDNSDVNADASTNGGSGGSDVSLSGVMSFIRDGFGLLGNGGIIALLSSTFVYLPNSIWIMLKFLVAMMIAVCIIKLVKDVVT